jgi:hypothetical protein
MRCHKIWFTAEAEVDPLCPICEAAYQLRLEEEQLAADGAAGLSASETVAAVLTTHPKNDEIPGAWGYDPKPATDADVRRCEHLELAQAQRELIKAAGCIDRAAHWREQQGDKHAARDAATYREVAKILRGEHDSEICAAFGSDHELNMAMDLWRITNALHRDALVRMIENAPPK